MSPRRTLALATAIAATLSMAACAKDDPTPIETLPHVELPATPSASPLNTSGLTTPEAAPSAQAPDAYRSPTSLVPAEADDAARQGAIDAALRTAQVWVQGTILDQDTWNAQLMDTLAPLARPAYDNKLWGYQVEQTVILGAPTITTATMLTADVAVHTNAGDLNITVLRDDETSPWLTSAIN